MLHEIPARFTKEQMQYLRDKSKKTGDSIAVILRHLVNKDMKKESILKICNIDGGVVTQGSIAKISELMKNDRR